MDLATTASVQKSLGRTLTTEEAARVTNSLIPEATALIEGHLGRTFDPLSPNNLAVGSVMIPPVVTLVASRMIVRALNTDPDILTGADSATMVAGPYTETTKFSESASSGGPYLSSSDKTMLAVLRRSRKSVTLRSQWQ